MRGPSRSSFYRRLKHCQRWLDSSRSTRSEPEDDYRTYRRYGRPLRPVDDRLEWNGAWEVGRRGRRNLPRVQLEYVGILDLFWFVGVLDTVSLGPQPEGGY